eukprot:CAMPEP_0185777358 /NCGR_PEP_ID=MMETSP1174-20130828/89130_1 /TAXON_ID=35687 /ORGANISM="Dictyocha speculum, Strain CCMP1381" /LENGTH=82 /DNA_ID=CAMNT_0028465693 /DNA_START=15 /DNA_END=263 /DNA_ORIENTATION=+
MAQQQLSPEQQQMAIQQYRNELNAQIERDLVVKIAEQCFKKCAGKSGSKLESKEQQCVAACYDRYLETRNVVNQSILARQNR